MATPPGVLPDSVKAIWHTSFTQRQRRFALLVRCDQLMLEKHLHRNDHIETPFAIFDTL